MAFVWTSENTEFQCDSPCSPEQMRAGLGGGELGLDRRYGGLGEIFEECPLKQPFVGESEWGKSVIASCLAVLQKSAGSPLPTAACNLRLAKVFFSSFELSASPFAVSLSAFPPISHRAAPVELPSLLRRQTFSAVPLDNRHPAPCGIPDQDWSPEMTNRSFGGGHNLSSIGFIPTYTAPLLCGIPPRP